MQHALEPTMNDNVLVPLRLAIRSQTTAMTEATTRADIDYHLVRGIALADGYFLAGASTCEEHEAAHNLLIKIWNQRVLLTC
jgi:dolichol kinase